MQQQQQQQQQQYKKPSSSQKDRMRRNEKRLREYLLVTLALDAIYIIVRLWFFDGLSSGLSFTVWSCLLLCHVLYVVCWMMLSRFATPLRTATMFNVADLGKDLRASNSVYFEDIIIVQWAITLLAAFSDWGWLLYLVIPLYAVYKLLQKLVLPMWRQRALMSQMQSSDHHWGQEQLDQGTSSGRARQRRQRY